MKNTYTEIKIKVSVNDLEKIENIFYRLGVFQLSIEDPRDLFEKSYINFDTYFDEDEIFTEGRNVCIVKYYLSDKENPIEFLNILNQMICSEKINCKIETSEIFEEDWANNWKKYYHTFKINDKIVVKPEWENYNLKNGEILINIDPGMAFGTGTHETTKLCMQLIDKYMKKDFFVYDVGTGSGILAILSSKLGARKVVAIDLDKVSVSAAKHNVSLNNLSNIEVLEGNLLNKASEKGDLIVANIIAEVIVDLIPDIVKILDREGIFITSGIIESRVDLIKSKLSEYGLDIVDEVNENGWFAFAIKNK